MNASHGTLLTALMAAALLAAGCDRPADKVARNDATMTPSTTPSTTSPPSSTASPPSPSASGSMVAAVDDTAITAKVKAALITEPNLKSMSIDVKTTGAVVTLSGKVDSAADKAKAVQLAETVEGVKGVVDHMTAKS